MEYNKQIEREVARFRNAINTIRTSDNPYYAENVKVQDYEISKKRDELEKKVAEINKQFNAEIETKIAEMEPVAAKSYFRPTESDKRLVEEHLSEFLADSKLAYTEKEKLDAFDRLEQKLGYLDVNGLHEVRKQLPSLFDRLSNDKALTSKLKGMNATLRELQTAEQLQLAELKEAKLNGVDGAYRRLRLTHPSYADYKNNRYGVNK